MFLYIIQRRISNIVCINCNVNYNRRLAIKKDGFITDNNTYILHLADAKMYLYCLPLGKQSKFYKNALDDDTYVSTTTIITTIQKLRDLSRDPNSSN